MMRRCILVALVGLWAILLSSCGKVADPTVLSVQIQKEIPLPAGAWYYSGREAWEEGYLSPALCQVIFGTEEPQALSYTVYLGYTSDTLCEIVIVKLATVTEAEALAAHLSARLSDLKKQAKDIFPDSFRDAAVHRRGKTVLYTLTPHNPSVSELFYG